MIANFNPFKFSFMSLYIFNLDVGLGSYIIFQHNNFTRYMNITFEMAIRKRVNIFRLFHFTTVLTKSSLKTESYHFHGDI